MNINALKADFKDHGIYKIVAEIYNWVFCGLLDREKQDLVIGALTYRYNENASASRRQYKILIQKRNQAISSIRKKISDYECSMEFVSSYVPDSDFITIGNRRYAVKSQIAVGQSMSMYDAISGKYAYLDDIKFRWRRLFAAICKYYNRRITVEDLVKMENGECALAINVIMRTSLALRAIHENNPNDKNFLEVIKTPNMEFGVASPIDFYDRFMKLKEK